MLWVIFALAMLMLLLVNHIKKTQRKYLYFIVGCILVVLIAGNYTNLDYANYAESYNRKDYVAHAQEWLYNTVDVVGSEWLQLSYDGFRLCMTMFSVSMLFYAFSKYVRSSAIAIFAFCMFPLFYYSTLFRTFIALGIFIYSIQFLNEYSPKNMIKFLGCIVVASGTHFLYAAYIILILCYFLEKSKIARGIIIVSVVLAVAISLMPNWLLIVVQKVLNFTGDEIRMKYYAANIGTRYGFIIWWGLQLLYYITAKYAYKTSKMFPTTSIKKGSFEEKQIKFIEVVYKASFVSFLFCPFYRVQANFSRLMLNQLPLVYLQYQCTKELSKSCQYHSKRIKNQKYLMWGYHTAFAIETIIVGGLWEPVVMEMMTHNWILRIF